MKFYTSPIEPNNRNRREKYPHITEYYGAVQKEAEDLLKEYGGGHFFTSDKFVKFIDCPICGSKQANELLIKWGGLYVQCVLCSHVYVKNMFRKELLESLYTSSHTNDMERAVERNDDTVKYDRALYEKYVKPLCDNNDTGFSILDIGAGAGEFVKYIVENTDFAISAVELCEETKEYLTELIGKRGTFFHGKAIEDIEFQINNSGYDLITLWGVLEHLPDPVITLNKIWSLLRENGTLLILVPNLFSHAFRILGVQVPTLIPREHINFFTLKSMAVLADKCGFTVDSMYGELPVIDLIYPYVDYSEKLIRQITEAGETYNRVYILKKAAKP